MVQLLCRTRALPRLLTVGWRWQSSTATKSNNATPQVIPLTEADKSRLFKLRNIGISAHIDSGKTTLTERILFYTGRIDAIHEVRGKDGVGAKMDSMELEREKGITIQSAATFTHWKDNFINIIDTPGHVDFTIEVERALRVLDSAILVVCASSGVQSQTLTVDRQMKRYKIPRLVFINKCDRIGANPFKCVEAIREKLGLNAIMVELPIGLENDHRGVIDIIGKKALYFDGDRGQVVREGPVPPEHVDEMMEKRQELIEALADVDEEVGEIFLNEMEPSEEEINNGLRRATIALKIVPVYVGSAFKNIGVQPLLDGVIRFLPAPHEVINTALDISNDDAPVEVSSASDAPLVALAFKLEDGKYGQLTYLRVYQGKLSKGTQIYNTRRKEKEKLPRLVRMHANEMEAVNVLEAGELGAAFGIECNSGDTYTDGKLQYAMTSMYVPDPVISLSVKPKSTNDESNFSKALNRFKREDPTFRVDHDQETNETIISGMGELHLEVYTERMRREYRCETIVGKPKVAFRETILARAPFDYTHKKQTGGHGQFGRVIGHIEPMNDYDSNEFVNNVVGGNVPINYIPGVEKGFREGLFKGFFIKHPVKGVRFILEDGQAHLVDSSELAFKVAAWNAFRTAYKAAQPAILEPYMKATVTCPAEYQSTVQAGLLKRRAMIMDSNIEDQYSTVLIEVPLRMMFGYSSDLRSNTQGKGEFSMEYIEHRLVNKSDEAMIMKDLGIAVDEEEKKK